MAGMNRKIRLKDVAERAGVAVNTASTILNRRPNSWASKETEERVFQAAAELGYRPSKTARALQSGRYHAIGLLIQDITNPFFSTLAETLEIEAAKAGYDLLIENCRSDISRERHLLGDLEDMEVDGVVLYLSDLESYRPELAARAARGAVTVVLGNGVPAEPMPVDAVFSDFSNGLGEAVEALLALGHRRFLFLSALAEGQADGGRSEQVRRQLVVRGVSADAVEMISCGPTMDHAREVCGRYFREHPPERRAAALIALNDVAAIGAMRAALDAGLAVPGDLSIVGVDDIPLCEFLPVPLASIRQRYRKIGAEAIQLLVGRIEGRAEAGELPRQSVFPTHFIARASVAAAPGCVAAVSQ